MISTRQVTNSLSKRISWVKSPLSETRKTRREKWRVARHRWSTPQHCFCLKKTNWLFTLWIAPSQSSSHHTCKLLSSFACDSDIDPKKLGCTFATIMNHADRYRKPTPSIYIPSAKRTDTEVLRIEILL